MLSEESPLLLAGDRDAVYQRFAPRKKYAIVAMVSGCGLVPRKWRPIIVIFNIWTANDVAFATLDSFCYWNIHSMHTSNCEGSRLHRCHRQVRQFFRTKLKLIQEVTSLFFYSLAVSLSAFAASIGGLIGASYSTHCKYDFTKNNFQHWLNTLDRWSSTRLSLFSSCPHNRVHWCFFGKKYFQSSILEVSASARSCT
jgi:hypothetical protein